mmetsp:Transcript_3019/g.4364  ORF Transcript_3019/g.4364 Transcript_3019/m.4364 type:complete len:153 (-) Transcript_3019:32-490(-)
MFSKPLLPNISAYVASTAEKILKCFSTEESVVREAINQIPRKENIFRKILTKNNAHADEDTRESSHEVIHRVWYQNPEVLLCLALCLIGVAITVWDDMCGRLPLLSSAMESNGDNDKNTPSSTKRISNKVTKPLTRKHVKLSYDEREIARIC